MAHSDWSERIAPDETARFDALAAQLRAIQQEKAKAHGSKSRALHAKPHVGLSASLKVRDGLPDWAKVGIFSQPGTFEAWVRLSNGGTGHLSDRAPDVRGFALKVTGVPGTKLIPGMEDAPTQDFLAILTDTMPFKTPDAFVAVVRAANGPKLLALPRILAALGTSAFSILPQLQKGMAEKVDSLVERTFFSVLPIRWGAAAVKYSFEPVAPPKPQSPVSDGPSRFADDVRARVSHAPLTWTLRVQPFVSERETPIEDPSVRWTSPWTAVADVVIPIQDPRSPEGQALATQVESFSFDPWHAPVEFRPLGAMMRARSNAYRDSTIERGAAKEPGPTR
ncbi:MAG: hypothetical protein SFW67_20935 [Myxococcaceae bacterium]|nr:hypothetical protein [Myxococcaceae bacterium]